MKKLISLFMIMTILLILTPPALTTHAVNTASFSVETTKQEVTAGEDFYVMVKLSDNPGFAAMQMTVEYNPNVIRLTKAEKGELIADGVLASINSGTEGKISITAASNENRNGDGTVLVLNFQALANGESALDLKIRTYVDKNAISLDSVVEDNYITVGKALEDDVLPDEETSENEEPDDGGQEEENIDINNGNRHEDNQQETPDVPTGDLLQPDETLANGACVFADVPNTHWAYRDIYHTMEKGLFSGVEDGRFAPDLTMTRAMFVTVLYRYAGVKTSSCQVFNDVPENAWYADAVAWAYEKQIISGIGDNLFDPDASITRGQIVTILCRYCNGEGRDITLLSEFVDGMDVAPWAVNGMIWALENGIMTGRQGKTLASNETATRAEAAVIFARLSQY